MRIAKKSCGFEGQRAINDIVPVAVSFEERVAAVRGMGKRELDLTRSWGLGAYLEPA